MCYRSGVGHSLTTGELFMVESVRARPNFLLIHGQGVRGSQGAACSPWPLGWEWWVGSGEMFLLAAR